jgi:hypothetical protein
LGVGGTHFLAEEIGVASKILDRGERDGVHAILDDDVAGSREARDPMSQGFDEILKGIGGQRAVNPAVALGEIGVEVLRAQHHLQGSRATHEPREVLGGGAAGELTECRLELTENRRLASREAHVTRQNELTAGGANPTLDLRDADEPAGAQITKQKPDRCLAGQLRRLRPVPGDSIQVDMGDEIVGVGTLEDKHPDSVISLGVLNQRDQITDQLGSQEIHRRRHDLRKQNAPFLADIQRFESDRKRPGHH